MRPSKNASSRGPFVLYYFSRNWRTQRAHARFKSRHHFLCFYFYFVRTKEVFVGYYCLIFQLLFFFFQRNEEYRFRAPLFLHLSKESRDAANRNEANLRIVRMSYVMHEDNKSLCRMIVHVILAKRWNTFKKGHSETIPSKTEVNSWRRWSLWYFSIDCEIKSIRFIRIKIIESSFNSNSRRNGEFNRIVFFSLQPCLGLKLPGMPLLHEWDVN